MGVAGGQSLRVGVACGQSLRVGEAGTPGRHLQCGVLIRAHHNGSN